MTGLLKTALQRRHFPEEIIFVIGSKTEISTEGVKNKTKWI